MRVKLTLLMAAGWLAANAQLSLVPQCLDNHEPLPVHPVPTERQLAWNETEFYAFFHYGMNTYTGLEWGYGSESEATFAPTAEPCPRQWLEAVKAAGMRGGIAVVKHHDGFCLWPTSTTEHNVTNSGNDYGRATNIPRDFAAAARELDMKYGFYVSPWDRNSAYYGEDNYVTDVFLKQCAELAEYGSDQFEMWFDGANGGDGYYGGKNSTVSVDTDIYYDIPNLRDSVHAVCPMCVMWGLGGEARWIGNESGYAGETCWGMVDRGGGNNNTGLITGWCWQPGESDAKATNSGWFWHSGETIKSAERLFQMYLETVGRNATLILNCPPDQSGSLPTQTVSTLAELGQLLSARLGTDLAPAATVTASATRGGSDFGAENLTDGDNATYWATDDGQLTATLTLQWAEPQTLRYLLLQEPIRLGQRVKGFTVECSQDGESWTALGGSIALTTVGYKRIVPLNGDTESSYDGGTTATYLRVNITDSRACPLLSTISVY